METQIHSACWHPVRIHTFRGQQYLTKQLTLAEPHRSSGRRLHRELVFMRQETSSGLSIQLLSFASGKIQRIASIANQAMLGLTVSPDERWVLYTQFDPPGADLMLVDGFE